MFIDPTHSLLKVSLKANPNLGTARPQLSSSTISFKQKLNKPEPQSGMVVNAYICSTLEAEAGVTLSVLGQPCLLVRDLEH